MAKKNIDVDKLNEAISNYDKAIKLLDEEISELTGFLAKLDADWDSPASDTYLKKMNDEIKKLKKTRNVISELRKYSKDTKTVFGISDRFLRTILAPISIIKK